MNLRKLICTTNNKRDEIELKIDYIHFVCQCGVCECVCLSIGLGKLQKLPKVIRMRLFYVFSVARRNEIYLENFMQFHFEIGRYFIRIVKNSYFGTCG